MTKTDMLVNSISKGANANSRCYDMRWEPDMQTVLFATIQSAARNHGAVPYLD